MIHDDREGTSPDSGLASFFAVVKEHSWLIPFLLRTTTTEVLA